MYAEPEKAPNNLMDLANRFYNEVRRPFQTSFLVAWRRSNLT